LGQKVTHSLTDAVTGLEAALRGTGGMAGTDPGGTTWAASYDHATAVTVGGMTDLTNACYKLAAMLELTGPARHPPRGHHKICRAGHPEL
jgi:hypothetical protein